MFARLTKANKSRLRQITRRYSRLTALFAYLLRFPLVFSLFRPFAVLFRSFAFRNYYALYVIFRKKCEMQLPPKYLINLHIIPLLF